MHLQSLSSLDFIRVFKETQKCSSKHKTATSKTKEVPECSNANSHSLQVASKDSSSGLSTNDNVDASQPELFKPDPWQKSKSKKQSSSTSNQASKTYASTCRTASPNGKEQKGQVSAALEMASSDSPDTDSDEIDAHPPCNTTLEQLTQTVSHMSTILNNSVAQQTAAPYQSLQPTGPIPNRILQMPSEIFHCPPTPQPSHYALSHTSGLPIGVNLPDRIKAKIWMDQYV